MAAAAGRDLRSHPVLALRALAVALLVGYCSGEFLDRLPIEARLIGLGRSLIGVVPSSLAVSALHGFLVCAVAGCAVALTHRAYQTTMVLFCATALLGFNIWWWISNQVKGWGEPGSIEFLRVRGLVIYYGLTLVMVTGVLVGGFAMRSAIGRQRRTTTSALTT